MKFGKSLSNQIEETLPEWRDKFLSYKDLKKRLKHLIADDAAGEDAGGGRPDKRRRVGGGDGGAMTKEEEDFLRLLEAELDKFNGFFVEKEEEYIIRQKELQDQAVRATATESTEELMRVRKEIVDFHGEMVLLENYSALNYTGLVKILKKYDKRTGALIRLPFIQNVLQQPFFTTDLLDKLIKECELMLDRLFPNISEASISSKEPSVSSKDSKELANDNNPPSLVTREEVPDLDEIEYMESLYMKSTVAALRSLKEIRSGSSTVSVFSLPPIQTDGAEERKIWNSSENVPAAVEQLAK